MSDAIQIKGLRLHTTIGVPDEERAAPQEVKVDVTITPERLLTGLQDDIDRTIDYFSVTKRMESIAAEGERHLIETLAEDLIDGVLEFDRVVGVVVTVYKFIIPQTDYVAVTVHKSATP